MDTKTLALLEEAVEPYRREGFVVTSQSEGAITLTHPPEKFSYLFFILTLVLLWPVAVVYLISFNNRKVKSVCVRVTSQGRIEETGYTLEALARERRRGMWFNLIAISIPVLLALVLWLRSYLW